MLWIGSLMRRWKRFARVTCSTSSIAMSIGALVLFALTTPSAGSSLRQVEAIAFDEPPVIDGHFEEIVWRGGEWHAGFTHIRSKHGSHGGEPSHVPTRFKIGFDEQALYLAVQMDRPAEIPLVVEHLERDGDVWTDDAIEFMINPNPSVDQYVHLIVNAGGGIFDSVRLEDGLIADTSLDAALNRKVRIEDDYWAVELAVPWADLGLTGDEGDIWTFNVARSSHATGRQVWSSFALMGDASLHQPQKFARLKIKGLDTRPFQWSIQPTGTSRTIMDDGQLKLETTVRVRNMTGSYQFFELDVSLLQNEQIVGEATFHRGLDAGAERMYDLAIPYAGEGRAQVSISLKGVETGILWRRQQYEAMLDYAPIQIRLAEPGYRDTIYATQRLDTISGEVSLNLPGDVLKRYSLDVSLHSSTGESLASMAIDTLRPRIAFELPLPDDMPDGQYHVTMNLTSSTGGKNYRQQQSLTKLPPPKHGREVRLDSNQILHVDGEPVVPFGAFTIRPHDDIEHVARQGYNVVFAYRFHVMGKEGQRAWLDRLHKNGMMAIIMPHLRGVRRDYNRLYTAKEEQLLRGFVEQWSQHPALLAWYMSDEPEIRGTLPARMQQLYKVLCETDPYHPTVMLNCTFDGIWTYGEYTDILMPDPYPGFYKKGGTRRRMDYVYHFIRTAEQAFDHRRAAWATPQAFNWADFKADRQDERAPNLIELRNMHYQVIQAKGTGWVWYTYMISRGYPDRRIGLGFLARETQLLRDVIIATDKARPVRGNLGERELLAHHRMVDGHHYVFATNLVNEPREVRLVLPKEAPGKWHVMSEGRSVNATGELLVETFEPFATHIYTTNETLANKLSLPEALERIERAETWDAVGVHDVNGPHRPLPADEVEFTRKHGW